MPGPAPAGSRRVRPRRARSAAAGAAGPGSGRRPRRAGRSVPRSSAAPRSRRPCRCRGIPATRPGRRRSARPSPPGRGVVGRDVPRRRAGPARHHPHPGSSEPTDGWRCRSTSGPRRAGPLRHGPLRGVAGPAGWPAPVSGRPPLRGARGPRCRPVACGPDSVAPRRVRVRPSPGIRTPSAGRAPAVRVPSPGTRTAGRTARCPPAGPGSRRRAGRRPRRRRRRRAGRDGRRRGGPGWDRPPARTPCRRRCGPPHAAGCPHRRRGRGPWSRTVRPGRPSAPQARVVSPDAGVAGARRATYTAARPVRPVTRRR